MALALLGPLLGSIAGPAAASALGLGISPAIAGAIGSGLIGGLASGNPLTGLEDAIMPSMMGGGNILGGFGEPGGLLGGLLGNGGGAAAAGGAGAGALSTAGNSLGSSITNSVVPQIASGGGSMLGDSLGSAAAQEAVPQIAGNSIANTVANGVNGFLGINGTSQNSAPTALVGGGGGTSSNSGGMLGGLLGGGSGGGMGSLLGLSLLGSMFNGAPIDTKSANTAFKSPGLTPYKNQSYVAPPAGYVPGVSPEPYMLSNPNNYATGGIVSPSRADAASMAALQLGLQPQQILQQQMLQQQLGPSQNYASGGLAHIPAPVHLQSLNQGASMPMRETARMAMPNAHMTTFAHPMHFAGGGGIPAMPPGMGVPAVAGDGSSDSIPATIDGKAPAMLSSGEFVTPADVVSHLGNGSSAAGVKALHGMVSRVRQAKTGSGKMPARINPAKMMPA